jgi:tetratricopeptide (TPR) repeat protein
MKKSLRTILSATFTLLLASTSCSRLPSLGVTPTAVSQPFVEPSVSAPTRPVVNDSDGECGRRNDYQPVVLVHGTELTVTAQAIQSLIEREKIAISVITPAVRNAGEQPREIGQRCNATLVVSGSDGGPIDVIRTRLVISPTYILNLPVEAISGYDGFSLRRVEPNAAAAAILALERIVYDDDGSADRLLQLTTDIDTKDAVNAAGLRRLNLAALFCSGKNDAEAIRILDAWIAEDQSSTEALAQRGYFYLQAALRDANDPYASAGGPVRVNATLNDAQAVLQINPDHLGGHFMTYLYYGVADDHAGSLKAAQDLMAAAPESVNGLLLLSWAYERAGKNNEALETINRFLALAPDMATGRATRARIYRALKKDALAERDEAAAVDLLGKTTTGAFWRIDYALNKGDTSEARRYAIELIRMAPLDAESHYQLARVDLADNDLESALDAHTKSIELGPKVPFYWRNRSLVLAQLGRFEEAISDADEAVSLAPKNAWMYFNRGRLYRENGNNDQALTNMSEAIRLAPLLNDPYGWRVGIYIEVGRLDDANADCDKLLTHSALESWHFRDCGEARRRSERHADAVRLYTQALDLYADDQYVLWSRGLSHQALNDVSSARADFEAALKLAKSDEDRVALQKLLDELE